MGFTALDGAQQGVRIHDARHQNLARPGIRGDNRNEAILVEFRREYSAFLDLFDGSLGANLSEDLSNKGAGTGAGPYEQYANQAIPGTFDGGIPVTDWTSFEDQTLYQHTTAYDILLNVQSLMPTTKYQAAYKPAVLAILSPRSAGEQQSPAEELGSLAS